MKRFLTAAAAFIMIIPVMEAQYRTGYEELNLSEVQSELKSHISFLSSAALEGRKSGSQGEADAASYLSEQLESYGLEMMSPPEGDLFGIRQESGDTLTSRNVLACIRGYDKELSNHYIVIGARLDNLGSYMLNVDGEPVQRIYYGANGNASGLSMLLQLAKTLYTNRILLRRSVIIAAFGSSVPDLVGSWYFLNRSFKQTESIDAMINLDMLGTASRGFWAYTASNADLNHTLEQISGQILPISPLTVAAEPCSSDHRSFYASGIPSIFFTTGMYPEYNSYRDTESIIEYDGMEKIGEYLYNVAVTLASADEKPLFDPSLRKSAGPDRSRTVYPWFECDRKPTFLGHSNPEYFLTEWVYRYLKYPKAAIEQGIQGKVQVNFEIDEKGKVGNVAVTKGVHPLLDEEALRVVGSSIDWKPGQIKGKRVRTGISIYVEFRLEKNKRK